MSENKPAMIVDMGKQYCYGPKDNPVTVRILCTDAPGVVPVVGLTPQGTIIRRTLSGCIVPDVKCPMRDLREFRQRYRREFWVNVYRTSDPRLTGVGDPFLSKREADTCARDGRIDCRHVIIEGEEGEGLT